MNIGSTGRMNIRILKPGLDENIQNAFSRWSVNICLKSPSSQACDSFLE